jgi:cell division protein FtsI (penicillin-binding protein 3)
MDVKTGKVLAAAEAPTVDPNNASASKAKDRGSRIFQFAFEPGSIMKSLTTAMVLDSGVANENDVRKAPDSMKLDFAGGRVKDSFAHETFNLTLGGVLRYSSNTGTVNFGKDIPAKTRHSYLQKFGFGKTTALRFQGESSGILHPVEDWDRQTYYNTMFGQGISVTSIQMASAYQALANGGVRLDPVLVESCEREDGSVTDIPQQKGVRVLQESVAKNNLELMEKVVEFGGVGRTAAIDGYRVGGKTGTAQVQDGKGYGSRFAISFYGVAPIENPKFVVGVTIYRPVGETNSARTTPVFKAIMQQALKHYRIPPSTTKSRDIPSGSNGQVESRD